MNLRHFEWHQGYTKGRLEFRCDVHAFFDQVGLLL